MHFNHARLIAAWNAVGDTSDAAVARRLGIDPSTAWRLRKGRSLPNGQTLARIEAAYGLTAAELYGAAQVTPRESPEGAESATADAAQ
ncbi:helix-turn-helix domain-containing protein [Streptomyces sp. NPDC059080]|uniref:helix-turn-helix domain-containing protein n=1 Tax=Streptomyces sp. NPDC059080 TaxID=3346718 RepID=UPI0036D1D334